MSHPERDLERRLEHLERVIYELEQGPESPARARTREIVRAVLDLHARGLRRMIELIGGADAAGAALTRAMVRDPTIAGLLLLHGLHPDDLKTRVRGAVETLTPMLEGEGARVTRLDVEGGTVRLGLERERGRGRLSAGALRTSVEQAIVAAAPDAAALEIDIPDTGDPAAFVPVGEVRMRRGTGTRP